MNYLKMFCRKSLILLFLIFIPVCSAESSETEKPSKDYAIFPVLSYQEDTSFIYGLLYIKQSPLAKGNFFQAGLFYTGKNQFLCSAGNKSYINQGKNLLISEFSFLDWPSEFYGIGNKDSKKAGETYTSVSKKFSGSYLWELKSKLYIGPTLSLFRYSVKDKISGGLLDQEKIIGENGTDVVGVGLHMISDQRDNNIFPRRGGKTNVKIIYYDQNLGSDQDFSHFFADYAKFISLTEQSVLALNGQMILTNGTVPFQFLPSLGNPQIMRGVVENKYCEENYLTIQAEYRFPIYRRVSGVTFISFGGVSDSLENLKLDKTSGGVGFRVAIDPDHKFKIRFDIGYSEDDTRMYAGFQEAF